MTDIVAQRVRYAGVGLDRAAVQRQEAAWVDAMRADLRARVVPVWRDRSLVATGHGRAAPPRAALCTGRQLADLLADGTVAWVFLGIDDEGPLFAVDLPSTHDPRLDAIPGGAAFVDLRQVGSDLGAWEAALLAYARGILGWHRRARFCGTCGSPTVPLHGGHLRRCADAACGAETYPRTDPAVIMLVEHVPNDGAPPRCLLAHHARLPARAYSTLAGFVEPGESLEDAVAREVLEETGIRVSSVRYQASQPWPFPSSLMLGFRAQAESSAIRIDPTELDDARWFTAAELAAFGEWGDEAAPHRLPRADSIARVLVDGWLADVRG